MVSGSFRARLSGAVARRGTSLCVGIDPRHEMLPDALRGNDDHAAAFEEFGHGVIDAVADVAVAVKPQSAFFEALGWRGVRALENICRYARERKLLVVGDVKRGDIGSTAAAYAEAAFRDVGAGPLFDAVTVNPYLGSDSIEPFVARAATCGGGVFVLLRTSNPSSGEIQGLEVGGELVYHRVARLIATWSRSAPQAEDVIGAVVGATQPGPLAEIRGILPDTWLLVPGLGVQGGDVDAVLSAAGTPRRILVNLSRNICFPWLHGAQGEGEWRERIRAAAERWAADLREPETGPQ